MVPMVTRPEEIVEVRRLLASRGAGSCSHGRHRGGGAPARDDGRGARGGDLTIEAFDADFYSIGTNDLTQYVLAAARDSTAVAGLLDPLHPAVLELIARVARRRRTHRPRGERLRGDGGAARVPSRPARGRNPRDLGPAGRGRVHQGIRRRAVNDDDGSRRVTAGRNASPPTRRRCGDSSTSVRPASGAGSPRSPAPTRASSPRSPTPRTRRRCRPGTSTPSSPYATSRRRSSGPFWSNTAAPIPGRPGMRSSEMRRPGAIPERCTSRMPGHRGREESRRRSSP